MFSAAGLPLGLKAALTLLQDLTKQSSQIHTTNLKGWQFIMQETKSFVIRHGFIHELFVITSVKLNLFRSSMGFNIFQLDVSTNLFL